MKHFVTENMDKGQFFCVHKILPRTQAFVLVGFLFDVKMNPVEQYWNELRCLCFPLLSIPWIRELFLPVAKSIAGNWTHWELLAKKL